jgi:hypothetical protein
MIRLLELRQTKVLTHAVPEHVVHNAAKRMEMVPVLFSREEVNSGIQYDYGGQGWPTCGPRSPE